MKFSINDFVSNVTKSKVSHSLLSVIENFIFYAENFIDTALKIS